MAMNKTQGDQAAQALIDQGKVLFGNNNPTVATMPLVGQVRITNFANHPDAVFTPIGDGMGIEVSQSLMNLADDLSIKFSLGHEIGHGFAEGIVTKIGLQGVSGPATEVVCDLASAHMLRSLGIPWAEIMNSLGNWQNTQIFTPHKSGDHPPGVQRVNYVRTLMTVTSGSGPTQSRSFEAAAKMICTNL